MDLRKQCGSVIMAPGSEGVFHDHLVDSNQSRLRTCDGSRIPIQRAAVDAIAWYEVVSRLARWHDGPLSLDLASPLSRPSHRAAWLRRARLATGAQMNDVEQSAGDDTRSDVAGLF